MGLVAVVAFLFTTGCNRTSTSSTNGRPPETGATPDHFATARATCEKNCKRGHGDKGEGGPVKLEDGTRLKVPTFREGHALRHPDSEFVKQITKGGDGMPAFKDKLTSQEIDDLVRFIRHEYQRGMTPPAEPKKSSMKGMKM